MILDRKYDEIMERIEITPEMRRRILDNIQDIDLSEKKTAKVIRPRWKQFGALAACFALVLVGIMERIEITPEMRRRILDNIQDIDLSEKKTAKVIRPRWKQFGALAACFALVLVGALTLPRILNPDSPPSDIVGNPVGDIVEVASAQELSQVVGFDVTDLEHLPFTPEQTTYLAYWKSMAEISYSGEGQTAVYRKAPGDDDVSGDFNEYSAETVIQAGGHSVTLKGTDEAYVLAIWTDGAYACSLSLIRGIPAALWQSIIPNS